MTASRAITIAVMLALGFAAAPVATTASASDPCIGMWAATRCRARPTSRVWSAA